MRARLPTNLAAIVLLMASWFLVQGLGPLRAQTSFGVIVGVVTDSSQAVVPNVSITVTNTATGIARQLKTNQEGQYRVPSLLPGLYSVKAELAGFQVSEVSKVELAVASTATVNITMQVGAVTQTVEVIGATPLLDTSTATIGTVINNKSVTNLPLNGRSYTDLMLLVPGAVNTGGGFFAVGGGTTYSVSSMRPDENTFTLDGVNANEMFFKQFGIQPSIDALQEFRVQTNINAAEYGGAGANVNLALKSGANKLHGSLFEFMRNDKLDAVSWFTNARATAGTRPKRPPLRLNQYGFVIGGPVYIPKVYNGRDKFFWLVNYEGYKIRHSGISQVTIPTTAQLGGDFTGYPAIYDPDTTTQVGTDSTGNPIYHRDQFIYNGVLNVIDPQRLSPAMLAYAKMFYQPSTVNNVWNTTAPRFDQWQVNTRADYKISDKLNFFARYSMSNAAQTSPYAIGTYENFTAQNFRNAVLSWTYLPSPTTVLDIKVGFNRSNSFMMDSVPAPGGKAYYAATPLQGMTVASQTYPLLFSVGIPNYSQAGQAGTPLPTNDLSGILNFTKIKGRHTLKTGASYDNFRNLSDNYGVNSFSYSARTTNDPQNSTGTGYGLASFVLGLPSSGQRGLGKSMVYMRWSEYHFYLQDDIRLTQRLTLNVGMRYEYDQEARDRDNRLSQFDRQIGSYVWAGNNPMTGQGPNARRSLIDPDFNNFAPRIGFAYQINPKTTLRGGYGIFYATNNVWMTQGPRGQWPYALSEVASGQNYIFPTRPIETFFSPETDVTPTTKATSWYTNAKRNRAPYTQQWNLGVQRQMGRELMLQVDYIGNQATKMPTYWNPNLAPAGPGAVDPRRPFPNEGNFVANENRARANYHAMQVRVVKQFSSGLQFNLSYAWSHGIGTGGGLARPNFGPEQDPTNWDADRADGGADRRHILTASYFYQLPFGHGQRYLSGASGIVNQLLGGWEITGLTHYNSGAPFGVGIGIDRANNGGGSQRPDIVAGVPFWLPTTGDKTYSGFNPAAFAYAPQYQYGNLGRNTFRGPGYGNWDLGLFKNFPLHGEGKVLQFRTEMFNAFNLVSMGGPNASYCEPIATCNKNWGRVTGTQSTARQIQFGLKLLF